MPISSPRSVPLSSPRSVLECPACGASLLRSDQLCRPVAALDRALSFHHTRQCCSDQHSVQTMCAAIELQLLDGTSKRRQPLPWPDEEPPLVFCARHGLNDLGKRLFQAMGNRLSEADTTRLRATGMGRNGLTAIHVAACSDRTLELLEALLESEAVDVTSTISQDGNQVGETPGGRTALHLAAAHGARLAAQRLLRAWPAAAARLDWDGVCPAQAAWLNGHTELCALLADAALSEVAAAAAADATADLASVDPYAAEEAEEARKAVLDAAASIKAGPCEEREKDLQKSLRAMNHVERERDRLSLAGRPRLQVVHLVNACLSRVECKWLLDEIVGAAAHVGWQHARHKHYATEDLPLWRAPEAQAWVMHVFETRIRPMMAHAFGLEAATDLRLQECFGVRYEPNGQAELRLHRDGTMFSFNVLLGDHQPPNSRRQHLLAGKEQGKEEEEGDGGGFEGGGTVFNTPATLMEWDEGGAALLAGKEEEEAMEKEKTEQKDEEAAAAKMASRASAVSEARRVQGGVGDCLMHCGQLLHGGGSVTRGTRFILVGFVAERWDAAEM